jgi:hypothetical protein
MKVFTSKKESPTVSREVMRRGEEFLTARSDQKIRALEGKYLVESSDGESYYLVDITRPAKCDCLNYLFHREIDGYKCKHILTVEEYIRG